MIQSVMKLATVVALLFVLLLLAGCQADSEEACPLDELPYPRPEPAYEGKLGRDFSPFAAALDGYTPEQATEPAE